MIILNYSSFIERRYDHVTCIDWIKGRSTIISSSNLLNRTEMTLRKLLHLTAQWGRIVGAGVGKSVETAPQQHAANFHDFDQTGDFDRFSRSQKSDANLPRRAPSVRNLNLLSPFVKSGARIPLFGSSSAAGVCDRGDHPEKNDRVERREGRSVCPPFSFRPSPIGEVSSVGEPPLDRPHCNRLAPRGAAPLSKHHGLRLLLGATGVIFVLSILI
jgi:hypothetical protein